MDKQFRSIEERLNREIRTAFIKSKTTSGKKAKGAVRKSRSVKREHAESEITYAEFLSDKLLLSKAVRQGIPFALFELIQSIAPFSEEEWAKLLGISLKSLQRYKQDETPFKLLQSEKIMEMAGITHNGVEVFQDLDRFSQWLRTPNFALGKTEPQELLQDAFGAELVRTELIRIKHGIFA